MHASTKKPIRLHDFASLAEWLDALPERVPVEPEIEVEAEPQGEVVMSWDGIRSR